jgi:hypothetical protein
MKLYFTRVACLLSLVLTACSHRQQAQNQPPLAPPIEDAPLSKPEVVTPKDLPPPVVTPAQPDQSAAGSKPQEQPKPAPKHKKPKPPTANTTQTADKPADAAKLATPPANQEASNIEGGGVPAIGQISSGGTANSRTETENTLNSTQHSLDTLNRKLTDQEEKTAAQIKEYIKQARIALASNDLDGAQNLANKAKLLLNELIPQ